MKIFCIGFNKTGTTSLSSLFEDEGYKVAPQVPFEMGVNFNGDNTSLLKALSQYDSYEFFQDVPFSFPKVYEFLYKKYPNAKYILSVRSNPNEWYESLIRYHKMNFKNFNNPVNITYIEEGWIYNLLTKIYGAPECDPYNKESIIQSYKDHNNNVRDFFRGKGNFIEINLSNTFDFERLNDFMGYTFKSVCFPHKNKSV